MKDQHNKIICETCEHRNVCKYVDAADSINKRVIQMRNDSAISASPFVVSIECTCKNTGLHYREGEKNDQI